MGSFACCEVSNLQHIQSGLKLNQSAMVAQTIISPSPKAVVPDGGFSWELDAEHDDGNDVTFMQPGQNARFTMCRDEESNVNPCAESEAHHVNTSPSLSTPAKNANSTKIARSLNTSSNQLLLQQSLGSSAMSGIVEVVGSVADPALITSQFELRNSGTGSGSNSMKAEPHASLMRELNQDSPVLQSDGLV